MSVYLDILVLVNTYISWLMLSLTSKLSHFGIKPWRLVVSAFMGGFSALIIIIPTPNILVSVAVFLLKLLSLSLISLSAFLQKGITCVKLIALTSVYIVVNIIFGGGVYLVQRLLQTEVIFLSNYSVYFDISGVNLILTTAGIYLAICLLSRLFGQKLGETHSYKVLFSLDDKSYTLQGIADTGNTVCDIFSGKPIIICTGFAEIAGGVPVPYSTVNGEGVLFAVKPNTLHIQDENGRLKSASALVAFKQGSEKRAVFNPNILV